MCVFEVTAEGASKYDGCSLMGNRTSGEQGEYGDTDMGPGSVVAVSLSVHVPTVVGKS